MKKTFDVLVFPLILVILCATMSYGSEKFKQALEANGITIIKKEDKLFNEERQKKIDNIGQSLLKPLGPAQINRGKEHGEWGFYVIDVGSKPNAFGGMRGVGVDYRMVDKLSGDELAFVIAHEIGHVVLKHSEQSDMGARERLEKINKGDLKELGREIIERTGRIPRAEERAADNLAMTFMTQANFNPEGAIKFFQGGLKDEGLSERTPEFVRRLYHAFSTHPTYRERYDTAVKWVNEYHAREAINELHNLRQRLADIKEPPKTALAPTDKLRGGDPQQNVTPVDVKFTQTFDGLFTQSADFLGSQTGTHSGTLTGGTRVNVIGDSRAGNFTGSITDGRTVAEPGYTPATHNNSAFSGSSVGTISAKGFKEGQLKGDMTVTIPAGTQTATVSGNITIETNGSLSMPSYSGPVTDNATSTKVGTMSGTWNQGATR